MLIALYPLLPSVKCEQVVGCCAKRLQQMKRLLAISIAFTTIGTVPVQAESVWLIMKEAVQVPGPGFALAVEKLEMSDMDQCEEQGAIFMSSERLGGIQSAWRDRFYY